MYKQVLLLVFILLTFNIKAQSENYRWKQKDVNYQEKISPLHNYSLSLSPLSLLKFGYKYFISDLDGDNCPFEPTCSSFYFSAIKRTNFIKASLMFSDRFLRDSNFIKRKGQYYIQHKRLYDPIENHLLDENKLIYK